MPSRTHFPPGCQSFGLLIVAVAAAAPSARAALAISGGTTKNVSCVSGVCTATAATAVLNKNDLEMMLASSNVQVVPGSVAMNIAINTGVTWASANTLTLDAYQSIVIGQKVSVNGTGGLAIVTNDGGSGGDYMFGPKGKVTFLGTSNSLTISGTAFTLLGSMSDVQAINNNLNGNYALANSYNASGVKNWVPLGTDGMGNILNSNKGFAGAFEGLGHTISNLSANIGKYDYAGLFGASAGIIRDLGVVGGTVTGKKYVGGLAGFSFGGSVSHSYSTGNVGAESSDISYVGGLVGYNAAATISDSYATGAVAGGSEVGGLVGSNYDNGVISASFATGTVTATSPNSQGAGGLVGINHYRTTTIENSYATGALPGNTNYRGGLVGYNDTEAVNVAITNSYATGVISNSGSEVGGFAGCTTDNINNGYWDVETSGISGTHGDGCSANEPGITGLTTAQLQSGLPSGFDPTIWAENPSINNGFPYLLANPPPQ